MLTPILHPISYILQEILKLVKSFQGKDEVPISIYKKKENILINIIRIHKYTFKLLSIFLFSNFYN